MKILIDPGHGGSDPGVTARTGQREDRTNLNVALYVMAGLEASGHTVIMTRTAHDQSVSVTARQTLIKKYKPDLVISIHHNGSASVKSNGAEICVQINNLTGTYDEKSLQLAEFMLTEFKSTGQDLRPRPIIRKANSDGSADYYGVLRTAAAYGIPAVITEYAFLSNPDDLSQVDTYTEQKQEADAIVKSVINYKKARR